MRPREWTRALSSVWSKTGTATTTDRLELGSAAWCAQDAGGWARLERSIPTAA